MTYKGKHHNSALCVVANRLLIPRILAVLKENRCYELRDFEGRAISKEQARQLVAQFLVAEEVRERLRSGLRPTEEKRRGNQSPEVTSEPKAPRNGTVPRHEDPTKDRIRMTKAQLAQFVFRETDRLLNSGGNLEEIRVQLHLEAARFFSKKGLDMD
jgi:hypothetical protein